MNITKLVATALCFLVAIGSNAWASNTADATLQVYAAGVDAMPANSAHGIKILTVDGTATQTINGCQYRDWQDHSDGPWMYIELEDKELLAAAMTAAANGLTVKVYFGHNDDIRLVHGVVSSLDCRVISITFK